MLKTSLRVAAVALIVTGCATSTPRTPSISQFEDIPVPKGLEFQPGKSIIIESPSVKAARLIYRGRLEAQSLGSALRTTLEANGWRHVSTSSDSSRGSYQVYEKNGNTLQVHIIDSLWYTYLQLDASRALSSPGVPTPPSALSTPPPR